MSQLFHTQILKHISFFFLYVYNVREYEWFAVYLWTFGKCTTQIKNNGMRIYTLIFKLLIDLSLMQIHFFMEFQKYTHTLAHT